MTFKVLKEFETETPSGITILKVDQKVKLSKEEAIPLIQDGLIQPVEKVVYRIYSNILQCFLWVVDTKQDMHLLRTKGITEAIYSNDEIKELRKLSKEDIKEIHKVKETFPESSIKEIKKK